MLPNSADDLTWRPVISRNQAERAVAVARELAARLGERERIEEAVIAAELQTAFPQSVNWQPYSIAQGFAGLAITCCYLDSCFPSEGWEATAHHYLELAVWGAESQPHVPISLFSGLGGLGFAAWYLSKGGDRYRRLLASIDELLLPRIATLADEVSKQQHGMSVGDFDVISGLSGAGAYLLCRQSEPEVATTLRVVINGLVELTAEYAGLPRWYTPPHMLGDETMLHAYPNGNLNCGLAHGIPGPLAFLSLAYLSGLHMKELERAIRRLGDWLLQNRCDDAWGMNWPNAVPVEKIDANEHPDLKPGPASSAPFGPSRSAWCYGGPGIARALWLAGQAIAEPGYCRAAINAMQAVYSRPLAERQIDSPTFCHGVAGLLQVTLRFAHDAGLSSFADAARALMDQLLSLYSPESRLGYYSLEPSDRRVDQPGLLDGAPGVALVLLAAATDIPPIWDRLFLLS